jgi:TfoX/Sxy family transcriptional regulator of competence genes
MAYDEQTAERVRKILYRRRGVVTRKMMGGLIFMVKGAMCCAVSGRGGLLVRIDPQTHARTLGERHVQPAIMRRRMMRGFVRVTPQGYRTDASLKEWVERGLAGIAARKDKTARTTTRRKSLKKRR